MVVKYHMMDNGRWIRRNAVDTATVTRRRQSTRRRSICGNAIRDKKIGKNSTNFLSKLVRFFIMFTVMKWFLEFVYLTF